MWITNEGRETFEYRWGGVDHLLGAGESEEIDEAVARIVFGFGVDDKSAALMRCGKLAHSSKYEDAQREFDNFSFTKDKPERAPRKPKNSAVVSPAADAGE